LSLPSERLTQLICCSIGIVSLFINCFALFLILKLRNIYATNILFIQLILQALFIIENFHFSILFIPYVFSTLGGGFCIGLLCDWPFRVAFTVNFSGNLDATDDVIIGLLRSPPLLSSSKSDLALFITQNDFLGKITAETKCASCLYFGHLRYVRIRLWRPYYVLYGQVSRSADEVGPTNVCEIRILISSVRSCSDKDNNINQIVSVFSIRRITSEMPSRCSELRASKAQ
ncbi:hypothetical protein PFISCL1PPCAC_13895, partial [Pristionchus fissidentatus]